jgi:hypothetical protein
MCDDCGVWEPRRWPTWEELTDEERQTVTDAIAAQAGKPDTFPGAGTRAYRRVQFEHMDREGKQGPVTGLPSRDAFRWIPEAR